MNIDLSMQGPNSGTESRSLYRWLQRKSPELHAEGVRLAPAGGSRPRPGEMGTAFEIVQFVFDNVAQYGALALAIASWRRAHHARCTVRLERDGVKITLTGAELDDAEAVARAFERLARAPDTAGNAPEPDGEENAEPDDAERGDGEGGAAEGGEAPGGGGPGTAK
ncbi:MAG TPA: hypothetical protein VKZ89_15950 [Thermobifida alba]|nr:hypothetical protein [Thermobifida alba]